MNTNDMIILARKHALSDSPMQSSAAICLRSAVALQDDGALGHAREQALRSLAYSVGAFHPDFRRVCKALALSF